MADETRHSRALEAQIITDPDELARKESFNVVEQFRAVADMVETYLQPERPFKLRPSHLLHLHRAALDGITAYAGNWRQRALRLATASTSRQRRSRCRYVVGQGPGGLGLICSIQLCSLENLFCSEIGCFQSLGSGPV
jgi:hypothetical protein